MKTKNSNRALIRKITLVGVLTALATVLSFIQIPFFGFASISLMLPVVVIGAALCGPIVGAWLTVIPNLVAFSEAGVFLAESPAGCIATLLLKGILAGLVTGFVYKLLSKKHPFIAIICSATATPVINTGVFVAGCYAFLRGAYGSDGLAVMMTTLVIPNFTVELILNIILCPAILRIIQIARKEKLA